MSDDERIKIRRVYIPPELPKRKKVAAYCRVSTRHTAQEDSLETQISKYADQIISRYDWELAGIYADKSSGKSTTGRKEFNRLMQDCKDGKVDLILTKSISRFGRNTVDIITNIARLRDYKVDAFFEIENLYASDTTQDFLLHALAGFAQEMSYVRSQDIKKGIEYKLNNGTSHLLYRPCYGYIKDKNGELAIDEEKAKNVRLIFEFYLNGHSVVSIIKELAKLGVKSPAGKESWSKRAVETLLANEKYIGNVLVGKTFSYDFPDTRRRPNRGERAKILGESFHPPIIEQDIFDKAQQERTKRSNVQEIDGRTVRKNTHYSMKKSNNIKENDNGTGNHNEKHKGRNA